MLQGKFNPSKKDQLSALVDASISVSKENVAAVANVS